jgi:hypothetical protein
MMRMDICTNLESEVCRMKRRAIRAKVRLTPNEIEAANRAEITAILILAGFRVYRPEADCYGEDLILRTPGGKLRAVQMKARPQVDWHRFGGRSIWMLFPEPNGTAGRQWFLVPHDKLYKWTKDRHGRAPKWNEAWSYPSISKELRKFLEKFAVNPSRNF